MIYNFLDPGELEDGELKLVLVNTLSPDPKKRACACI